MFLIYTREQTKPIRIGNVVVGGNSQVVLQSMLITKTRDVPNALRELQGLVDEGCQLVRVAIFDDRDIVGLKELVALSPVPLIADIHFNPDFAIKAIHAGAAKIRLNPGNINESKLKEIVELAKAKDIPIRVGVNSGSLPFDLMQKYGMTAEAMLLAARRYVKSMEDLGFSNIVLSLKASTPLLAIQAYRLAANEFSYPLHLGITEAGSVFNGTIKSVAGLAPLLLEGIGNTIRISLAGDSIEEVKVAKRMLNALGLYRNLVNIVACPTCGRLNFDMFPVVREIEEYVKDMKFPLTVSILGCAVNGPGEARESDIGIAGGMGKGIIYVKGEIYKQCREEELVKELKALIDEQKSRYDAAPTKN